MGRIPLIGGIDSYWLETPYLGALMLPELSSILCSSVFGRLSLHWHSVASRNCSLPKYPLSNPSGKQIPLSQSPKIIVMIMIITQ